MNNGILKFVAEAYLLLHSEPMTESVRPRDNKQEPREHAPVKEAESHEVAGPTDDDWVDTASVGNRFTAH